MLVYVAKRLAGFVPLLLGITLVSFLVMWAAPGNPVDLMTDMNPKASPEAREKLERYYGLDKPIYVQYGLWLGRIVQGDGVHAAQLVDEIQPVAAVEQQRRLAIRLRGELGAAHLGAQLDVVVDLAVGDQRGPARLAQRLVAGGEIDDGQAIVDHPDIAAAILARPVGAAMGECRRQARQDVGRRTLAAARHHSRQAAHQAVTARKKSR